MASAYSVRRDYGKPSEIYDFNLIDKALAFKQNKYDANASAIQQQIDQVANLQLARGVDKDYLQQNLNSLVEQVNGFGNTDLSSNSISSSITSHVKQALDDTVIQAYKSTRELQRTYGSINEIKSKHPDKWSIQNEEDAMQGVAEYMNNTEAGAEYSGREMTPYTDINAVMSERMKNAQNYLQKVTKVTKAGRDYFYDEKRTEIDARRLRAMLETTITPDLKNQMRIDANYNMKGVDRLDIEDGVREAYQVDLTKTNDHIQIYERELNKMSPSNKKYNMYKQALDSERGRRASIYTRMNSLEEIPEEALKTMVYSDNLMGNYEQMYGGVLSEESTMRVNSVTLNREKFQETRRQNKFNNILKKAELGLKISKAEKEFAGVEYSPLQKVENIITPDSSEVSKEEKRNTSLDKNTTELGSLLKAEATMEANAILNMPEGAEKENRSKAFKLNYTEDIKREYTDDDVVDIRTNVQQNGYKGTYSGDIKKKLFEVAKDAAVVDAANNADFTQIDTYLKKGVNTILASDVANKKRIHNFTINESGEKVEVGAGIFKPGQNTSTMNEYVAAHLKPGVTKTSGYTIDDATEDAKRSIMLQMSTDVIADAQLGSNKDKIGKVVNYQRRLLDNSAVNVDFNKNTTSAFSKVVDDVSDGTKAAMYNYIASAASVVGSQNFAKKYFSKQFALDRKVAGNTITTKEEDFYNAVYTSSKNGGVLQEIHKQMGVTANVKSMSDDIFETVEAVLTAGGSKTNEAISQFEIFNPERFGIRDLDDWDLAGDQNISDIVYNEALTGSAAAQVYEENREFVSSKRAFKINGRNNDPALYDGVNLALGTLPELDATSISKNKDLTLRLEMNEETRQVTVNGYKSVPYEEGKAGQIKIKSGEFVEPITQTLPLADFIAGLPSAADQKRFISQIDLTKDEGDVYAAGTTEFAKNPYTSTLATFEGGNGRTPSEQYTKYADELKLSEQEIKFYSPENVTSDLVRGYRMKDENLLALRKEQIAYLYKNQEFTAKTLSKGDYYATEVGYFNTLGEFIRVETISAGQKRIGGDFIATQEENPLRMKYAMLGKLVQRDAEILNRSSKDSDVKHSPIQELFDSIVNPQNNNQQ